MDASTRRLVRDRAANRCEYCLLPQSAAPFARFHVEHIRSRQHRGGDEEGNLCLACQHCNIHKGTNLGAFDPDTDERVWIFNPREQQWHEHFQLDGTRIIGLTPVGRATAQLLQMNAEERIKIRKELIAGGEFPD